MHWLEIIEVRSWVGNRDLVEEQFRRLINEISRDNEDITVRVYNKVNVESDMSIHLYHHSKNVKNYGSTLGLCLASSLKEFGRVHHSVLSQITAS